MVIDYIVFVSGGNDSVALCQYLKKYTYPDVSNCACVHSKTGWTSPDWNSRMVRFKEWVKSIGFSFHEVESEGMPNLIRRKKAFPANRPKFCTYELKIKPAMRFLETIDPERHAECIIGIRREESPNRRDWPEEIESSENHGGRPLWSPLADFKENDRNDLIKEAGWEVLPHRSRECSPCVNSNRSDLRMLPESDINKVRSLEKEMGLTMFRPHRFMGAKGIDEIIKWANSERGQYQPDDGCDSGMCGD